jgi:hypothetical protein
LQTAELKSSPPSSQHTKKSGIVSCGQKVEWDKQFKTLKFPYVNKKGAQNMNADWKIHPAVKWTGVISLDCRSNRLRVNDVDSQSGD